jgi:hypothetical protein
MLFWKIIITDSINQPETVTAKKQPKTSGAHVTFIPIFVLHATTEHFIVKADFLWADVSNYRRL